MNQQSQLNMDSSPDPEILNAGIRDLSTVMSTQNTFEESLATVSEDVSVAAPSTYTINEENKWGWITLYVVTIVVAVLGNLLFIIGSLCTRRSRNTGHYLLINLSIRKRFNIILRQIGLQTVWIIVCDDISREKNI